MVQQAPAITTDPNCHQAEENHEHAAAQMSEQSQAAHLGFRQDQIVVSMILVLIKKIMESGFRFRKGSHL